MSGVFLRKEIKFFLDSEKYKTLLFIMRNNMEPDKYGKQTIRNVYFDNDNFELISRSIEKPLYKEKVRVRAYGALSDDMPAYFELKKKYDGVVYKRRILTGLRKIERYVNDGVPIEESQIFREIDYLCRLKELRPKIFIAYEREAFYGVSDADFRITFDTGIRFRTNSLSVASDAPATTLKSGDFVLMETKCLLAYPRWLIDFLCDNKIYKTSFSKYGTVYTDYILPALAKDNHKEKEVCSA